MKKHDFNHDNGSLGIKRLAPAALMRHETKVNDAIKVGTRDLGFFNNVAHVVPPVTHADEARNCFSS